jgi:hypothetical protein
MMAFMNSGYGFADEELLCEVIRWGVPGEIWDGMEGVVDFLQD